MNSQFFAVKQFNYLNSICCVFLLFFFLSILTQYNLMILILKTKTCLFFHSIE